MWGTLWRWSHYTIMKLWTQGEFLVSLFPTLPFPFLYPSPSYLLPSFFLLSATLHTSLHTTLPFHRTFLRDFLLRFTAHVAKLSCSQWQPLIPGIQSVLHQDGGCREPSQSILHQDGGTQWRWSHCTIMKLWPQGEFLVSLFSHIWLVSNFLLTCILFLMLLHHARVQKVQRSVFTSEVATVHNIITLTGCHSAQHYYINRLSQCTTLIH